MKIIKNTFIIFAIIFIYNNSLCYGSDWKRIVSDTNLTIYIDDESMEKLSDSEIGIWVKHVHQKPVIKTNNGKPVTYSLSYLRFTENKMFCFTETTHYYVDGTHQSFPPISCNLTKIIPDTIADAEWKHIFSAKARMSNTADKKFVPEIAQSSIPVSENIELLIQKCKDKLNAQDYLGAIGECNYALRIDDASTEARFWRSKANYHLSNFQEALKDLDFVIEKQPNDIQALNNRGIVYRDMDNYDFALSDITRALLIDKNYFEAYMNRAKLNYNRFEFSLAVEDYSKVIELKPALDTAFSGRALAYLELKQSSKAMEDASKAIKINPKNQNAYLVRASVYAFDNKDFASALKEIDNAMQIDENKYEAWYGAGLVFQKMNDPKRAVICFSKTLELSKQKVVDAYFLRGVAYIDLGEKNKALEDWRTFLKSTETDHPRRTLVLELIKKFE